MELVTIGLFQGVSPKKWTLKCFFSGYSILPSVEFQVIALCQVQLTHIIKLMNFSGQV
jgi:hypothetical protein